MAAAQSHSEGVDYSHHDPKRNAPFTSIVPKPAVLDRLGPFGRMQVESNWTTFVEQPLSGESIADLFANAIPAVRHPELLSTEECARLVDVVKTAQVVSLSTYLWR